MFEPTADKTRSPTDQSPPAEFKDGLQSMGKARITKMKPSYSLSLSGWKCPAWPGDRYLKITDMIDRVNVSSYQRLPAPRWCHSPR